MAEVKISTLLDPAEMGVSNNILRMLHVKKTGNVIQMSHERLSLSALRKHAVFLNKEPKDALAAFCEEKITEVQQSIAQKAGMQADEGAAQSFVNRSMIRHLHQAIERLKPFAGLFKWYHKNVNSQQRVTISPCAFSNYRPRLQFEVLKKNGHLQLLTCIRLNEGIYPLSDFKRHHFLLNHNNEYFVLSYKDFQTLEWLQTIDVQKYATDPFAFSQHLLQRLEVDYTVNRNNHFAKTEVRVKPAKRVLLSELSNAFLMLTPQYLYDGFLVEGAWTETWQTVSDGEEYIIYRDREEEQALVDTLRAFHDKFAAQRNGYFYLPFADAQKRQWFLKVFHSMLDQGIELTGMDLLNHFRYSPYKAQTNAHIVSQHGHLVTIDLSVQFGTEKVNLASLQKMLLSGQKAILLKDSSLGILGDEWMQQYATIVKHGKVNKDLIEVPKYLAITEHNNDNDLAVMAPLVKQQWWSKWRAWQTNAGTIYEQPEGIAASLRPYQQKGYEWLCLMAEAGAGGCLADDMGLGKTLQSICFVASQVQKLPASCSIVVCPSSLIYNWQQEFTKFAPGLSCVVYHGAARQGIDLQQPWQVIITSYGTLRADGGQLLSKNYQVAIIDESHNIKNPSAQITTAVSALQANIRIALSGTPVVNNTFDLYAQLNFALPGLFGSREFFKREYADAIDRDHDEEKIKMLQKLTAPFILRRTKEQVAPDLPEKNEIILWCKMGAEQQEVYNSIRDQVRGSLFLNIKNDGLAKSKLSVIQGMLRLRQICNSPLLLPPADQTGCADSVKTSVVVQELKNIVGKHKALVFSQFTGMLDLLGAELEKQGIDYYRLDGSTPAAKRAMLVNAFQSEADKTHVFLISLKAGNVGLTLTAADYVFLFDPWWNTAVEQQAIDRTHRIGQTKNVFAYKMICKDTIEEKIIELQQRKQKIAGELVSDDNGFISSLTEEDISYLFA